MKTCRPLGIIIPVASSPSERTPTNIPNIPINWHTLDDQKKNLGFFLLF